MVSFYLFPKNIKIAITLYLCLHFCFLISFLCPIDAGCKDLADKKVLIAGNFSEENPGNKIPAEWKPLLFKKIEKHTLYSMVEDNGHIVVKAVADASASGIIREISINLKDYPIISWRWKIGNILEKGDVHSKSGDDYPARVYITFAYEPEKLSFFEKSKYEIARLLYGQYPPYAAINYIWESNANKGLIIPNSYTNRTMMFVIESGKEKINQWIEEERNVYKDYIKAFGEEPPMVSGIAVMTDTDNTGEKATAFYGDIKFKK